MLRKRKAWLVLLIALVAIVVALPLAGGLFLGRSLPRVTGTVSMDGLSGPVEVIRDRNGIPYIYAETDHDALFALGYVHAQDRLWQMEMNRRIGAGRLSEVLGEATIDTDKFLRTLGVYRAASAAWNVLTDEARAALEAYAAGINTYLAENHQLPPEFTVLGYRPEPWQPADSLVWAKMMAWDLGDSWGDDLLKAELAAAVGPERAAQLLPSYPADGPIILPPDAPIPTGNVRQNDKDLVPQVAGDYGDLLQFRDQLRKQLNLGGKAIGSNNWVVKGTRTASGMPLLANDPHLGAQIPSIWYLAALHGDRLHVVGATLPGLPAVVIGHNEHIAWGVTNLAPDVQDLFVERINPDDPNQYDANGTWQEIMVFPEEIRIDGEDEPILWSARATQHGPLISDATSNRGESLALRWPSLDPDDTSIVAFLGLNYASNWDEFTEALRSYVAPSQNFVYADTQGNIGYYGPGRIPVRAQGDGSMPVPGWTEEYAWTGWIPFEDLPHVYNPADGYVVTANNRVTPDNYPYFITDDHDWTEPYRAARILELLTEKTGLTPEDFQRIQGDQISKQAQELLPLLLGVTPEKPEHEQALALLSNWNAHMSADLAAPALYQTWYKHLYLRILGDDLGGDLGDDLSESHQPLLLAKILRGEASQWCDNVLTPSREDCPIIALEALDDALEELTDGMGADMTRWRWGTIHVTQFPHNPFSEVDALKGLFHRSIETGGDNFTVNPSPYDLAEGFDSPWLPSFRMIVDLGDLNNSRFMHTTGQSGNRLSGHYDDFIPKWRAVEYVPMYWTKEALQAEGGASTLTLEPANESAR